jgi:predicted dehydrogenase
MRIAVVGTGSIGRRHIANLRRLGIGDVLAVSEHNRHDSLTVDGATVAVCHDFGAALATGLDAVVIANPTSLHLDYLARAVEAGCHVYLEKPASTSAVGLHRVEHEAARRSLVIAMGTMYRFNARLESLRARVQRGDVGQVLCAETVIGEHIADYHPDEDYRESYTARAELGGGVLLTQIHQIDWLNWIFGPFETVFAIGGKLSDLGIDVEDTATYLLRAGDGTPAYGHLDYLQRPKRAGMTVTGTAGRLEWDLFSHALTYVAAANDAEAEVEQSDYDRNAMFFAAMDDFLNSVRRSGTPRATLADGHQALAVVDAIKASMKSGRVEGIAP